MTGPWKITCVNNRTGTQVSYVARAPFCDDAKVEALNWAFCVLGWRSSTAIAWTRTELHTGADASPACAA